MAVADIPILRWLTVSYRPVPDDRQFMQRAQTQCIDDVEVTVAVLDAIESRRFFGVPMARRGMQPVRLKVVNRSRAGFRLNLLSIDPNYFSPHEAAAANHFSTGRKILELGFLAWIFLPLFILPLIILLPLKIIGAVRANRLMDAYFQAHAFRLRPILPGGESEGFVFTQYDIGSKILHVRLLGFDDNKEFLFNVPVPGLKADYLRSENPNRYSADQLVECDIPELRKRIAAAPRATTNRKGTREGDPVNLVVAGEFPTILSAFGARWDETETITLSTCWKTFRSFFIGSEYRYSPVSPLYLEGRSQDFALQRIRSSINERLHLRLWATPLRFQGVPVWIGQVSRDIGVRFTWRTWNLTTHRIDSDVDEARDYVVEDLFQAGRLEIAGYLEGVGACEANSPRKNLTGDTYFTDGRRAAVLVSPSRTEPRFVAWT
jgi:hypothetical protein